MEKIKMDKAIKKIIKEFDDRKAKEEDRLKTLEDKVKFIMEKSKTSIFYVDKDKLDFDNLRPGEVIKTNSLDPIIKQQSLQDLYDEENEPKISDIGEIEKHSTCKHTPIYSGKCCEECKPTVKDNWRCGKCEIEESGYQSGESIPEHSIHCKKRNEPTVKENVAKPFTDTNLPTVKDSECKKCNGAGCIACDTRKLSEYINKDQKIEEIISDFDKWFDSDKKRAVELYSIDDIKSFKQSIESWLRDKLNNL